MILLSLQLFSQMKSSLSSYLVMTKFFQSLAILLMENILETPFEAIKYTQINIMEPCPTPMRINPKNYC